MIKILFFGEMKDRFGRPDLSLALPTSLKVESLFCQLLADRPDLQKFKDIVLYGVNQVQVDADHLVQDGDEIAFMPPMSGG